MSGDLTGLCLYITTETGGGRVEKNFEKFELPCSTSHSIKTTILDWNGQQMEEKRERKRERERESRCQLEVTKFFCSILSDIFFKQKILNKQRSKTFLLLIVPNVFQF